jgi:ATP-dependent DNA helicase RecG
MTSQQLQLIIQEGENTSVELKTSKDKLNKDVFESICAFLNRRGGHLILGVNDKKEIAGVSENAIQHILDTLAKNANNPQKLNPPYYLSPEVLTIEDKKVIVVYVPESSQVHSSVGKIFDRNEDGDFNITNNSDLVTQLYLRKQKTYSENQVFPFVSIDDFKPELFNKVRALVRSQRPNHPWISLTNEELLKSAGLYKQDFQTGKFGYTLAAILLLAKDEIVLSTLPHHKTDAILRKENLDRYDDRDDIRVNLIESYERLMDFVAKHLPDKFYQEGDQRVSHRDRIFREIIGNLLIHREFINGFPAKLIIEKKQLITENWNKPHGHGTIDPMNFTPYPKNPMIARFFKEIGWVDELGSGVRNVHKYIALYTKRAKPIFIEEDVFKTIIPLEQNKTKSSVKNTPKSSVKNTPKSSVKNIPKSSVKISVKILDLIRKNEGITIQQIAAILHRTPRAIEKQISTLKDSEKIIRVGGDKIGYWKILSDTTDSASNSDEIN